MYILHSFIYNTYNRVEKLELFLKTTIHSFLTIVATTKITKHKKIKEKNKFGFLFLLF